MKTTKSALLLLIIAIIWFNNPSIAQEKIDNIPVGRYLVIGTFHIKQNAIGFAEYVKKMDKYEVKLSYHPVKKYYYVYIKGYAEDKDGLVDVRNMRRETEFIDTWFYVVTPYKVEETQTAPPTPAEEPGQKEEVAISSNPVKEKKKEDRSLGWVKASTSPSSQQNQPAEKENKPAESETGETGWVKASSPSLVQTQPAETEDQPTKAETGDTGWVKATNISTGSSDIPTITEVPSTYSIDGKYKFYFNSYYTRNYKEIKGPVEIINPKSLKLLRTAQSLELVQIADPNNGTHSVQLIANIFGYKKVQHDINMEEPLDSINMEFFHFKGDTLVADFPLQRYETGEIATMYNVFFYKDAVIMKPISKFELNSLVEMLKENEVLRIKIHGHTNGNAPGKILLLPDGSEDYFTMTRDVIENKGTAKELSLQRANIIKRYLMSYGIDEGRMEVIGWGGKRPIYDKMDKLAIKNVRVEIEILEQ